MTRHDNSTWRLDGTGGRFDNITVHVRPSVLSGQLNIVIANVIGIRFNAQNLIEIRAKLQIII